jgi:ABC-type nitrate/sulfonate/bicarbonate transport system substrate-binding protein
MSRTKVVALKREEPLRIGFVPNADSAPLIYAKEAGLFEQHGLDVELKRELTWSGIGDKVINGEFEAAQVPAPLPFLANLSVDSDHTALVSAMVLSVQGSALTISKRLWEEGVRDPQTLQDVIRRRWGRKTCTFGIPSRFSTQSFLLEKWFATARIDSRSQVRILAVPPEHMFATMKLGYVDGYFSPEPWNSLAVQSGEGICLATSPDLSPLHPETVLVVRQGFAAGAVDKHRKLIQVLVEACRFAERQENREMLAELLSQPAYVNAPRSCLSASLAGPFAFGHDRPGTGPTPIFFQDRLNEPTDEHAQWLMQNLYKALDLVPDRLQGQERPAILKNAFRRDIFLENTANKPRERGKRATNKTEVITG